jgi:hypothetical protein
MSHRSQWADRPTRHDQLGFGGYCNALAKVIWAADTPITLGIFGIWGSGKTSLMQMVRDDVQSGKDGAFRARTVWSDAWMYGKEDALWRVLLLSTMEALRPGAPEDAQQHLDDLQASPYRDVHREEAGSLEIDWSGAAKGAIKLGLSLVPLLQTPTLGDVITALGGNDKAPKNAITHLVDTFKRERLKIHRDRVQFLEQCQEQFSVLVDRLLPATSRLVVFIDDLDRCLPEKAIEVLKAIKLFLNAERCVFVVGVERRIIEPSIQVKYQRLGLAEATPVMPITSEVYLEKIIQLPFHLPPLELRNVADFAQTSLMTDFARPGAEVMARDIEANPRKIKRGLNTFRLQWTLANERGMVQPADGSNPIEPDLLAKMVVIQSRWPDLYTDVVEYPNLLANLEDHFDRLHRETESPLSPEGRAAEAVEAAPLEGVRAETAVRAVQTTLVTKYENRKPRMHMLITPKTNRFKGKAVPSYIYLTRTVVKKPTAEDSDVQVDARIWDDMLSNDPTRIEAAIARLDERQKLGYVKRLFAMLADAKSADLSQRIATATALGMLGDPRLDTPPLYEMEMLEAPAGPFRMGSNEGDDNEKPEHPVDLDAFEIARYPLTNQQYEAGLDANPDYEAPRFWTDRMFPVVGISWHDAAAYATWLSRATCKQYRLPTETEWEKAARGQDGRTYPWGKEFDPSKCYVDNTVGNTTPMGIYLQDASPYGTMDMVGNVWEWVCRLV